MARDGMLHILSKESAQLAKMPVFPIGRLNVTVPIDGTVSINNDERAVRSMSIADYSKHVLLPAMHEALSGAPADPFAVAAEVPTACELIETDDLITITSSVVPNGAMTFARITVVKSEPISTP